MDRQPVERVIRYEPLPSQRKFHESPARFKGFSGPIGSGKSQALCQEAIRLAYSNPGRMGLLGAPTFPMLRDSTQAALFEILHQNRIPHEWNKADNALTLGDTRSRIVFRAVDDYERLRGTNLAWFGIDELTYCPEDAWLRLEGRLRDPKAARLCGFAVWTPKGFDWVYRKFISEPVRGYEAVIAAAYENRHLLEKVPDFYERLKSSYDESFFRQEVMGEYLSLSGGLVYSAFERAVHVRELSVDLWVPLLWALDFNVDPMCSVVAQMVGEEMRVLDEIVLRRATTAAACEEFCRRYPAHRPGVTIYGDASGNRQQTTGDSDYQIIREYFDGIYPYRVSYCVPRANPAVRDRVVLTNSRLRNSRGEVSLFVDPKCRELILDFEQVSYKADSTEVDKERDRRRTHLSDALGYLLWQECRPGPGVGERGQRLL
ncbi:MAG: terminase large subunit domain-containing protein [Bryobacteraceae bacterium]